MLTPLLLRFFEGRQSKGHMAALKMFEYLRKWLPKGEKVFLCVDQNTLVISCLPVYLIFISQLHLSVGTKLLMVGQLVQGHEAYLRALQRWVLDHDLTQASQIYG